MVRGRCSGAGRKGFWNGLGLTLRLVLVSVVLITFLSPPGTMANGSFENGKDCETGTDPPKDFNTRYEPDRNDWKRRTGKTDADYAKTVYESEGARRDLEVNDKNCKSGKCVFHMTTLHPVCAGKSGPDGKSTGSIQRGSIPGTILMAFLAPGFISCLTFF